MRVNQKIKNQKAFKEWKYLAKKNNIKINSIKFKSYIDRKNCKFSISTLDSNLTFKGINYDRAIQLEGTSVVVIPLIFYQNKLKTILVSQFRAPLCATSYEFPSGSAEYKNLKKSVQAETLEEIGIKISLNKIKRLNKKPIFMLPANNYSKVFFYYFKLKLLKNFDKNFQNKLYGNQNEGEYIKIKLIDIKKVLKNTNSASVFIGYSLLKEYGIL